MGAGACLVGLGNSILFLFSLGAACVLRFSASAASSACCFVRVTVKIFITPALIANCATFLAPSRLLYLSLALGRRRWVRRMALKGLLAAPAASS